MKTKLKDNIIFRSIIIPICLALCFFGQLIPPFGGLSSDAIGVLFIFLGTLILWLTIGIDWPSLVCIFALGFIKPIGFKNVALSSFGNETFVFLLFTFICTYALSKTSIIKRVAIGFVDNKAARKNGYLFILLFLSAVLLLGLVISPSVLFVVILPILNEILEIAGIDKTDKIAKVMMIGLGFTVSISSGMTPIAHVFPVLAMKAATDSSISYLQYMAIAMPVGIILFFLMYFLLILIIRPDLSILKDIDVSSLKDELDPINKKDISVIIIFGLVLLLWIVPQFFKGISPTVGDQIIKNIGTSMPPLLGTIALCIIRIDGEPLLKVDEAIKKGVPWSALIMCAGALALGAALTNKSIGLEAWLNANLSQALSQLPAIAMLIIFALWAAIQTNLSSNMVTATLVATVAYSILTSIKSPISTEALICIIGMLASFAFATPPSMPHIAIVASSESATTKDVFICGSILMVASVIVALLVGYPIGMLLF